MASFDSIVLVVGVYPYYRSPSDKFGIELS